MLICGLQKTTLLDYPGHVAATLFTGGCNFRCPFCHNAKLLLNPEDSIPEEEIFAFLEKRKKVLTGICITGGEPTLQPDLPEFIRKVKALGYLVKLDTNGYRPEVLRELLKAQLIDYLAMDVKAGLSNYDNVCGLSEIDVEKIKTSIALVENSGIEYEFRTTVVKELHSEKDFLEIREQLSAESPYFLQSFKDSGNILEENLHSCTKEELERYLEIVKEKITNASLRGVE